MARTDSESAWIVKGVRPGTHVHRGWEIARAAHVPLDQDDGVLALSAQFDALPAAVVESEDLELELVELTGHYRGAARHYR